MSHQIIRAKPAWQRAFFAILLVAMVCAAIYIAYEQGRAQGGDAKVDSRQQIELLSEELDEVEKQLAATRELKAIKERSLMVEQEAHKLLKASVAELQDETLELKEELTFYRSILAPEDAKQGLRIQSAIIEATPVENVHHYKVVLTQVLNNNTSISGKVGLTLEGTRENKPEKLALKQIAVDGEESKSFKFKYFQYVEGDLAIPEGFVPQRMVVSVEPKGRSYKDLEKVVAWPR